MDFLKKFFTNSYVLLISACITITALVCHAALQIINGQDNIFYFFLGFDLAFMALLVIALLIAYIKGESSYQKMVMGAVLASLAFTQLLVLSGTIALSAYSFELESIMTMAIFIIFINHLYLQVDHKGDKRVIKFNFVMISFVFFVRVGEFIFKLLKGNLILGDYLWSLEFISLIVMIICIETRIMKYKINRYEHLQKGTWTDEEKEKQKLIFKLF